MSWVIALLLYPFVAVAFFAGARVLSQRMRKYLPEGRFKRMLYSPLPGHGERRRS